MNPNAERSNFPRIGDPKEVKTGANFTLVQLGEIQSLRDGYGVRHPAVGGTIKGKVFLQQLLGLTAMEISFGVMPANASMPFIHKHRVNEEVYLFIHGRGQFQIDGQILEVREGTAIRVSPEGARTWRNTSSENLFYIVIQAKEGSLTHWTGTDGVRVDEPITWPANS